MECNDNFKQIERRRDLLQVITSVMLRNFLSFSDETIVVGCYKMIREKEIKSLEKIRYKIVKEEVHSVIEIMLLSGSIRFKQNGEYALRYYP